MVGAENRTNKLPQSNLQLYETLVSHFNNKKVIKKNNDCMWVVNWAREGVAHDYDCHYFDTHWLN